MIPIQCHACGRNGEIGLSALASVGDGLRCTCGSTDIDVLDKTAAGPIPLMGGAPGVPPQVGDRVRWDGDMSNVERDGIITNVSTDGWLDIEWEPGDYRTKTHVPHAQINGPRWHHFPKDASKKISRKTTVSKTAVDEWEDVWNWANVIAIDPTIFARWKNSIINDYLNDNSERYEGQGFGSSDGNHLLFPAMKAAKSSGNINNLLDLNEYVRNDLGLEQRFSSKTASFQVGDDVLVEGETPGKIKAVSDDGTYEVEWEGTTHKGIVDDALSKKSFKTADITAVDGPMRYLKPATTGMEFARCSSCFAQFEHTFQDPADSIPNCPVCGSKAVTTAGSNAWAVTATKAIVERRAKRQSIAGAVLRSNPGMSRQAAFTVAQETIKRFPKTAKGVYVEKNSPFHAVLVSRGWTDDGTNDSHGTAFVSMNEPAPQADNGIGYRPAPEPMAYGLQTDLDSGRANATPFMKNKADGNETKKTTRKASFVKRGENRMVSQDGSLISQIAAMDGTYNLQVAAQGRVFTIFYDQQGATGDNGSPVRGDFTGDYEVTASNKGEDWLVGAKIITREHVSPHGTSGYGNSGAKQSAAEKIAERIRTSISSLASKSGSYRISVKASVEGRPHLAVATMTSAQWDSQRPLLEAKGTDYLVERVQG